MLRVITLAAIGLTATFDTAHAQKPCATIEFQSGQSAAIVNGEAPAETPYSCFILNGEAHKSATINVTKPSQNVAFNIAGLVDNQASYSFKTEGKPYHIEVYDIGRDGPTPFTMVVTMR